MVVLALALILPPLLQSTADAKTEDARAANLLVYQDQLRELEADLKSGLLAETQYDQDKEEIERRLLEDVGDRKHASRSKQIGTRKLAYGLAIVIPVTAIVFYLVVGNPKSLDSATVPPNTQTR